jgi:hypothetical protein
MRILLGHDDSEAGPVLLYICPPIIFLAACAYRFRATIYSFHDHFHIQIVEWPFVPSYVPGRPHAEFVNENAQSWNEGKRRSG